MILNIPLDHLTLVPLRTTRTGSNNCTRKETNCKKNLSNAVIYLLTNQLKSDLKECFDFLKEKYDMCSLLFSLQFRKGEWTKRKKKQNRRKAKNSKLDRYIANKDRILKMIAPSKKPNTSGDKEKIATESLADEDRITNNDLNLEEISNFRKFDAS